MLGNMKYAEIKTETVPPKYNRIKQVLKVLRVTMLQYCFILKEQSSGSQVLEIYLNINIHKINFVFMYLVIIVFLKILQC